MRNDYLIRCHTEDKRDLLKELLFECRYLTKSGNFTVIINALVMFKEHLKRMKAQQEAKTQPE